jgi:hypothetical protein
MSNLVDNVRSGLAALADDVTGTDLHDRVLASSRRLRLRRAIVGCGAAAATVAATAVVVLAIPLAPDAAPPPLLSPGPSPTGPASPDPTGSPTSSPTIPTEAILPAANLGPEHQAGDSDAQSHSSLSFLIAFCGQPIDVEPVAGRHRYFESGGSVVAVQEVYRYRPGGAEQAFTQLRDALPQCARVNHFGTEEVTSDLTLVRSGFAGDGSVLVEDAFSGQDSTATRYHAGIWQGDLYAQIELDGVDQARALEIATTIAGLLCAADPSC